MNNRNYSREDQDDFRRDDYRRDRRVGDKYDHSNRYNRRVEHYQDRNVHRMNPIRPRHAVERPGYYGESRAYPRRETRHQDYRREDRYGSRAPRRAEHIPTKEELDKQLSEYMAGETA